jgi:hypothetical protein
MAASDRFGIQGYVSRGFEAVRDPTRVAEQSSGRTSQITSE